MDPLTWFTRLVVLADLLFATVWVFVVLPYGEPIASGEFAMHRASVWAACGLAGVTVLIGLLQLWIEPLRLLDGSPIINALMIFLMAAIVVAVERRYGG